jgi:hypothetical protein
MTGHEYGPDGVRLADSVRGWDLNYHYGFRSFEEAKSTLDDNLPSGSLWLIRGEVYELIEVLNQPLFRLWEAE